MPLGLPSNFLKVLKVEITEYVHVYGLFFFVVVGSVSFSFTIYLNSQKNLSDLNFNLMR